MCSNLEKSIQTKSTINVKLSSAHNTIFPKAQTKFFFH